MIKAIDSYIKGGEIKNELDLERALMAHTKLRIPAQSDTVLDAIRSEIVDLIVAYEKEHWDIPLDDITDKQIKESDLAELIVEKEEDFLSARAGIIKDRLKKLGIKQKQLCEILNHKSHTYISDLVRGRHPMSLNDMVILSKVLKINLSLLIPKTISYPELKRVSDSIKKLNNRKLSGELLELATA